MFLFSIVGKLNTVLSVASEFVTTGGLTLFSALSRVVRDGVRWVKVRSAIDVTIAVLLLVGRPLVCSGVTQKI